jgi:hypothetical protein
MGSGFTTHVDVLTVMPDGTVWEGGASTSGSVAMRSPLAKWTGTNWVSSDNNLVSTVTVQAITPDKGSKLYVGYSSFGTAIQAGLTTITNIGTARSYLVVQITAATAGSGRIFEIHNWTTNRVIYLNLTLNVGENATLVFQPDNLSFVTVFRPNIASTILAGSNEADFFIQNGANVIGFLAAGSTATATISWRPAFVSLDDVP